MDTLDQAAFTRLPYVGEPLVYHPRGSEVRRGRTEVAALCIHVWPDQGSVDLVVVHEADDLIALERVAQRVGPDPGWSFLPSRVTEKTYDPATAPMQAPSPVAEPGALSADVAALRAEFAAFRDQVLKALYGEEFEAIEEPIVGVLGEFEDRLKSLEEVKPGKARSKR